LNAIQTESAGEGIHVGIVDTVGEPPKRIRSQMEVIKVHNDYLDCDDSDPRGHGTSVIGSIADIMGNVSLSTFQAIGPSGDGHPSDVTQAVIDAGSAGVDILNLSLGIPHECRGLCSLSREAEIVANVDDVCIIAATGNNDDSPGREGVNCPALSDATVGVAGCVTLCDHEIVYTDDSGQWWLEDDGEPLGPFCGGVDCCEGSPCSQYQNEVLWPGNVSFHNAAPNVVAPVTELRGTTLDDIQARAGTSFAAPLVTALLGGILGDLKLRGVRPSSDTIRNGVKYGSTELNGDSYNKFDMKETWDWFCDEHSISTDIPQ
jgi:subtilisin family serine protease